MFLSSFIVLITLCKTSLAMISHIAKDYLDFKSRLDKYCPNRTTLSTFGIKSLDAAF